MLVLGERIFLWVLGTRLCLLPTSFALTKGMQQVGRTTTGATALTHPLAARYARSAPKLAPSTTLTGEASGAGAQLLPVGQKCRFAREEDFNAY